MSGWYTTRDSSTWFEASDSQAWIPSSQNSSQKYASPFPANDLKTKGPKSNVGQRMSKEVKVENQPPVMIAPAQKDKFVELPFNQLVSDQNAWNAYVLSNTSRDDFLTYWDQQPSSPSSSTTTLNIPETPLAVEPEKVVFSKLKRNVDIEEQLTKQNLYKTEYCQSWIKTGACRYGGKCQYAHGQDELRSVIRHPKYKTEICKTFSTTGQCPYGNRCRFIHQVRELRPDESEIAHLQLKLQEINLSLAPDPVFPSPGRAVPAGPTTDTTTVKKGSRLPFLQKLRKL